MSHTTAREILEGLREFEGKTTSTVQYRALKFARLLVFREYPDHNLIIPDVPQSKDTQ